MDSDIEDIDLIDKLLENETTSSILKELGVQNLIGFLLMDEKEEEAKKFMNPESPHKYYELLEKLNNKVSSELESALTISAQTFEHTHYFPTHLKELDEMLKGGFYSNSIYEIFGSPGSGKTTLCYYMMVVILSQTRSNVLFIDSGTSFSYYRLEHSFKKYGVQSNDIKNQFLPRVKHLKAFNAKALIMGLISLIKHLEQNDDPLKIKLIIIDSFSSILNTDDELSDYAVTMEEIHKLMRILTVKYYIGFIVINACKSYGSKFTVKPKSILATPWHLYMNTSIFIEQIPIESKSTEINKRIYKAQIMYTDYNKERKIAVFPLQSSNLVLFS